MAENNNNSESKEKRVHRKIPSNSRFVPYSFLHEMPHSEGDPTKIRKLVSKTIGEKYKILKEIDEGSSCAAVRRKYDIPKQTLSNWRRNRQHIYDSFESDGDSVRVRASPFVKINEACYAWFEEAKKQNIHVNGKLVKEKALSFVDKLQVQNFQASDGWLARWKKRKNISFDKTRQSGKVIPLNKHHIIKHFAGLYTVRLLYSAVGFSFCPFIFSSTYSRRIPWIFFST